LPKECSQESANHSTVFFSHNKSALTPAAAAETISRTEPLISAQTYEWAKSKDIDKL
jgi:hypothetical protein